jgi:hypothetical protein
MTEAARNDNEPSQMLAYLGKEPMGCQKWREDADSEKDWGCACQGRSHQLCMAVLVSNKYHLQVILAQKDNTIEMPVVNTLVLFRFRRWLKTWMLHFPMACEATI